MFGFPRHKWPKSWESIEDPVPDCFGKIIRRSFFRTWMGDDTELGMYVRSSKTGVDIKIGGKKQNMTPMWKELTKNVDIDEPTSFLDHENLGCTQRECKPNETIIGQLQKTFESRISAGATENYRDGKNLTHKQ